MKYQPIIPIIINEKLIYNAIVDTGAEVVYIPHMVAMTIQKSEIIKHSIDETSVIGVTGSHKAWNTHITTIEIPGLKKFRNVPVVMSAEPDNNLNILIGPGTMMLKDYNICFDTKNNELDIK